MTDSHIRDMKDHDDLDSPGIPRCFSLMNNKICPFSPYKFSDASFSQEETSYIFKKISGPKELDSRLSKLELNLSSAQTSSQRSLSQYLADIQSQILNLSQQFSSHQNEIKQLNGENVKLMGRITQIQESLEAMTEENSLEKAKCKCRVF